MKNIKKILASVLVLSLAFAFTACGASGTNSDEGNAEAPAVVETEAPAVEETEAVVEETEAVETPVEEPAVTYTYAELSQTMYAKQDVNVRDLPSVEGNKVDGLSFAEAVTVTGKCNETGWYRISYGGKTSYVNNYYLVSEKPVPQEAVAEVPAETEAPAEVALEKSPWELYAAPTFNEVTGCVNYFILENDWPQVYDGINMEHFAIGCEYYTECTGKTGEYVFHLYPMGRYQEGKVAMIELFVR